MATSDIEKENLEAHVELCAERYKQLDTRLSAIESKVGNLQKTIEDSYSSTVRVLIGSAGTVIVGVLSLIGVIVTKLP